MRKVPRINGIVEASPHKSVAGELEALRKTFREVCRRYTERVDSDIIRLREKVLAAGKLAAETEHPPTGARVPRLRAGAAEAAQAQVRDLRDMLMLLMAIQVKPADGRRKDLKKVETSVEDLRLLTERWGKTESKRGKDA